MTTSTLTQLFYAQSVAVVGASNNPNNFGGQVLRNLINFGYTGALYGVHPRYTTVAGQPCYPSLSTLPQRPDCVALAVSNQRLLPLLAEANELGIPAAVVFGDPQIGSDRLPQLEERIVELAQAHDMAICGPNAMGLFNLPHKLVISGYPVRANLPLGNVALITHSGTVFDAMTQNNRGVSFNYAVSGGNEAVITMADYLHFVLNDPSTRVVALYLETVRDPSGFIAGLELAAERQIPIVALKVGLSERGQALTQAHTGALAGGAEIYAALFRQYGVCQVRSLDELMDAVELFSWIRRVRSRHLAVLMESGGERSLVADLAETAGLSFAALGGDTQERLANILEPGVTPDNPLDAFGTGQDVVGTYRESLLALHDEPNTGLLLLAMDLVPDSSLSPQYIEAVLRVRDQLRKPFIGLVNLTSGAGEISVTQLRQAGIPVLMGTETGLRAIRHLIDFNEFLDQPAAPPEFLGRPAPEVVAVLRDRIRQANGPLDEHASKNLLAAYGLAITREHLVTSVEAALQAAENLGYPVVLKTAASNILHKSDVGGLHLHLADANAVRRAYLSLARQFGPPVLVQEMVWGGTEMILGMKTDPQFGPILLVGLGGVFVEIYRDIHMALPPLSRAEAERLPTQLRGQALLEGARGRPAVNQLALTEALLCFSTFVSDLGDLLSEVDVNPLTVLPTGAVVVDALMLPR
jgi:acetate---CoA ligase (ADP-forming)